MTGYIIYSLNSLLNLYGIIKVDSRIFKKLCKIFIHNNFKQQLSKKIIKEKYPELRDGFDEITDGLDELIDVIPMLELNKDQLDRYLELYDNESEKLDDYCEMLSIIKYNQLSLKKYTINKKLDNILESLSDYWDNNYNLKLNYNKDFVLRRFKNTNKYSKNNLDYLEDLVNDKNILISEEKYYMKHNSNFSNSEILLIYNNIPSDYLRYSFVCNLLSTRTHCHLILNNIDFLKLLKPMFEKYKIVFKYLIGYSWLSLTLQEKNNKFINDDSYYILDIDTANNLPIFPFSYDDINQNPYACVLLDKELINLKNNCMSLNMMKNYEKYYGLCDSLEFKRRLNIFINSKNEEGILQYFDWNSCVITGSTMTACGMKYNPLIDLCKININDPILSDIELNNFFFHYYADSDVDILVKYRDMFSNISFLSVVDDLVEKLKENDYNIKVSSVTNASIIISDEFICYELDNIKKILENKNLNINNFKKNYLDNIKVKEYFYNKYYINWKDEHSKIISNLDKLNHIVYDEYKNKVDISNFRIILMSINYQCKKLTFEKYIYLNDIHDNEFESINLTNKLVCKVTDSIRYKIEIPNIRTLEIFKGRSENYMSTINRFHMGFVRAYWNGKTVKCLPSYITSMMLQLSTDYNYFSSIRDPIEIINKYRSRGFGVILNNSEKNHMIKYNCTNKTTNIDNKWLSVFSQKKYEMFGPRKINDIIFKYSKITKNFPEDCYQLVNNETCISFAESFGLLNDLKLNYLLNYKTISNNGSINKITRYLYKDAYDCINT